MVFSAKIRGAPPVVVTGMEIIVTLDFLVVTADIVLCRTDVKVIRVLFVTNEKVNIDLGTDVKGVKVGHLVFQYSVIISFIRNDILLQRGSGEHEISTPLGQMFPFFRQNSAFLRNMELDSQITSTLLLVNVDLRLCGILPTACESRSTVLVTVYTVL